MIPLIRYSTLSNDDQPASDGTGDLLQRDYWAVIRNCSKGPREVMDFVRNRFADLAPEDLVRFSGSNGASEPLAEGQTLFVKIRMAKEVKVRVSDVSENSLTLATQNGHPEAGRITFGAYRNDRGDVIFHIRSRARSRSKLHLAGFLILGDPMQNNTWTDFIDRLAHMIGDGVVGSIHSDMAAVEPTEADETCDEPTFIARGS